MVAKFGSIERNGTGNRLGASANLPYLILTAIRYSIIATFPQSSWSKHHHHHHSRESDRSIAAFGSVWSVGITGSCDRQCYRAAAGTAGYQHGTQKRTERPGNAPQR